MEFNSSNQVNEIISNMTYLKELIICLNVN